MAKDVRVASAVSIRRGYRLGTLGLYVLLSLGAVVVAVPFVWMVLGSMKTPYEIVRLPPHLLPDVVSARNYVQVLTTVPFVRFFLNSVFVSTSITLAVVFTSSLAGYIFAKFSFPGRQAMFTLVLATMLIPFQLSVVPLYLIVWKLRIYNTYLALIVPALVDAYSIFLVRQFMHEVPDELLDAARIDGANEYRIYAQIVMPMVQPVLATVGIFSFAASWNSFLWPVIAIVDAKYKTVQLGLATFSGWRNNQYGALMAASTMAVVPILVVFSLMQRGILRSVNMSDLKG